MRGTGVGGLTWKGQPQRTRVCNPHRGPADPSSSEKSNIRVSSVPVSRRGRPRGDRDRDSGGLRRTRRLAVRRRLCTQQVKLGREQRAGRPRRNPERLGGRKARDPWLLRGGGSELYVQDRQLESKHQQTHIKAFLVKLTFF